jgi:hypothetical protein
MKSKKMIRKGFVDSKLGRPPRKASTLVMEGADIVRWVIFGIKRRPQTGGRETGTNGNRRKGDGRPEEV